MKITLSNARKDAGYTQTQVALQVGVSVQAYRLWEQGTSRPNAEHRVKLEQVLERSDIVYGVPNA